MLMSLKRKAAGAVAAMALGLAIGGATTPASAAIHIGGGGGSHGSGGAFHGGVGSFHGGMTGGSRMMADPHFGGGGRFHIEGFHRGHRHHFVGFGGYYGPYYDCGSPYALYYPALCAYPYGY